VIHSQTLHKCDEVCVIRIAFIKEKFGSEVNEHDVTSLTTPILHIYVT